MNSVLACIIAYFQTNPTPSEEFRQLCLSQINHSDAPEGEKLRATLQIEGLWPGWQSEPAKNEPII